MPTHLCNRHIREPVLRPVDAAILHRSRCLIEPVALQQLDLEIPLDVSLREVVMEDVLESIVAVRCRQLTLLVIRLERLWRDNQRKFGHVVAIPKGRLAVLTQSEHIDAWDRITSILDFVVVTFLQSCVQVRRATSVLESKIDNIAARTSIAEIDGRRRVEFKVLRLGMDMREGTKRISYIPSILRLVSCEVTFGSLPSGLIFFPSTLNTLRPKPRGCRMRSSIMAVVSVE